MRRSTSPRTPLPYIPTLFPGELLSSWLRRTGVEFGVSLQTLATHFGLSHTMTTGIDHDLQSDDIQRLASAMRSDPAEIRRAMHRRLRPEARSLQAAARPIQVCVTCRSLHQTESAEPVSVKAWFEIWEIECRYCCTPFSPPGGLRLHQCNAAREMPHWFAQIRPAARVGSERLRAFAQWPHIPTLSPVAILVLMSRSTGLAVNQDDAEIEDGIASPGHHRVAEHFVPGLHDLCREDPLLPTTWSEAKPVQLVTARAILLAAMARFCDDPPSAFSLIRGAGGTAGYWIEQWFRRLPSHSQAFLSASCATGRGAVSNDCSISRKSAGDFSGIKRSRM